MARDYSKIQYDMRDSLQYVPQRVKDIYDTTTGLTDQLYEKNAVDAMNQTGGVPLFFKDKGGTYEKRPDIPTVSKILSAAKIDQDLPGVDLNSEKAARYFVDNFSKNMKDWKEEITNAYGSRGWETAKSLFRQTANDLMQKDIADARKKAMRDAPLNFYGLASVKDPFPSFSTAAAEFAAPRTFKAVESGKNPGASEIVRDALSQALYAVPVGGVAKVATYGRSPIVRKGAQLVSQAVAPSAVAALDYAADPEYTGADAALDAAFGTATNIGINRYLAPRLGKALSTAQGELSQRISPEMKMALQDNPTKRDVAEEIVDKARKTVDDARRFKDVSPENYSKIVSEGVNPPTAEEVEAARAVLQINSAAKRNSKALLPASKVVQTSAVGKSPDEINDIIAGVVNRRTAPLGPEAPARYKFDNPGDYREAFLKYKDAREKTYAKELAKEGNALRSLFYKPGKSDYLAAATPENLLKTWVVNQIGNYSPEPAEQAMSALTYGVANPRKIREWDKDRKEKSKTSLAASDIIGGAVPRDLTAEDVEYLKKIEKDPTLLTVDKGDAGFKMWLLKRGHELLRGTAAHRPLWEVK